jgi:hypothetical protein
MRERKKEEKKELSDSRPVEGSRNPEDFPLS